MRRALAMGRARQRAAAQDESPTVGGGAIPLPCLLSILQLKLADHMLMICGIRRTFLADQLLFRGLRGL